MNSLLFSFSMCLGDVTHSQNSKPSQKLPPRSPAHLRHMEDPGPETESNPAGATYATAAETLDPLTPTALGQVSNPHLCCNLGCCSQILNPLRHSGDSRRDFQLSKILNCLNNYTKEMKSPNGSLLWSSKISFFYLFIVLFSAFSRIRASGGSWVWLGGI